MSQRREVVASTRFREREDRTIKAAAQIAGESRASFVREAALRDARRVLRSEEEAPDGSDVDDPGRGGAP